MCGNWLQNYLPGLGRNEEHVTINSAVFDLYSLMKAFGELYWTVLRGKRSGSLVWFMGIAMLWIFVEQGVSIRILPGPTNWWSFNLMGVLVNCHGGHHLLRMILKKLARLAKARKEASPIHGCSRVKPPNSDQVADLWYQWILLGCGNSIASQRLLCPKMQQLFFYQRIAAGRSWTLSQSKCIAQAGKRIIRTAPIFGHRWWQRETAKLKLGILKAQDWIINAARKFSHWTEWNHLEKAVGFGGQHWKSKKAFHARIKISVMAAFPFRYQKKKWAGLWY